MLSPILRPGDPLSTARILNEVPMKQLASTIALRVALARYDNSQVARDPISGSSNQLTLATKMLGVGSAAHAQPSRVRRAVI